MRYIFYYSMISSGAIQTSIYAYHVILVFTAVSVSVYVIKSVHFTSRQLSTNLSPVAKYSLYVP